MAGSLSAFFESMARRQQGDLPNLYGYKADLDLNVGFFACATNKVTVLEKPFIVPSGQASDQGYMILYAYCQKEGIISLLNGQVPPRFLATSKEPLEFPSLEAIADNFGHKDPAKGVENSKFCVPLRVPAEIAHRVAVEGRDMWLVRIEHDKVTPLIQACKDGDANKVIKMLDAGMSANTVDEDHISVLMIAAFAGSAEACQALVSRNADVNYSEPTNKRTPLMFAAQGGHAPVVSTLLDNGADHSKVDSEEQTALGWAAVAGKEPAAKVLRDAGCNDPNALKIATAVGHQTTMSVLGA